jgi:putative membrane protein
VRYLLIRWAVLGVAIAVAVAVTDGIDVHGGILGYLAVAAVLGLVNALVRPLVRLFTLPITLMTLGLFSIVINALMLILTAVLSPVLSIDSFRVAIVGALVISVVSVVLNWVVAERRPGAGPRR